MKSPLYSVEVLFRLPLFTVLGFAIIENFYVSEAETDKTLP